MLLGTLSYHLSLASTLLKLHKFCDVWGTM